MAIKDMNKQPNIVFIGFMGVGKTSIGKTVAEKISYDFVDTDQEIEKKINMSLEEFFLRFGEKYFREIESETVNEVSNLTKTVIATGGGVVLNRNNITRLRHNGLLVHLKASPEVIYKNVLKDNNRTLLRGENLLDRINELYNERKKLYKEYDYEICIDGLAVEQVSIEVLKILKEKKII